MVEGSVLGLAESEIILKCYSTQTLDCNPKCTRGLISLYCSPEQLEFKQLTDYYTQSTKDLNSHLAN